MFHNDPGIAAPSDRPMSRWVDIAFGVFGLATAAVALIQVSDGFPGIVSGLLAAVGLATLLRGVLVPHPVRRTVTLQQLAVAALCMSAAHFVWQLPSASLAQQLGPPEYASLMLLEISVAVAFGFSSRLRALGMALFGLMLGLIGINLETGAARFTFGMVALADGIPVTVAALGMLVVADAALFTISPSAALEFYARHVRGWTAPRLPWPLDIVVRLAALAAITLAGVWTYQLNSSWMDVRVLAALAILGVLARVLGLNRLVLLIAMSLSVLLEENIRRSLLLSRGDFAIFLLRPISLACIVGACAILCGAAALSIRARRPRLAAAQSGSQLKMSAERSSL